MEPHLNIFQAYHGGNHNSPDQINRLEDNLTRAFLIVLKYLKPNEVTEFLKNLGFAGTLTSPKFDLQNLTDKNALRKIQKSKNQWILVITRDRYEFSWKEKDKELFQKIDELIGSLRKDFLSKVKKALKCKNPVSFKDVEITSDEASSYYELLHECRPDGWIYNDKDPFGILIESKVGGNKLTNAQIYRHLSGNDGFNLKENALSFEEEKIISVTWEGIINELPSKRGVAGEIIKQFKEYIIMSGEVLDLEKLNKKYDQNLAKSNLKILAEKIDHCVSEEKLNLVRFGNFGDQWCAYGLSNSNFESTHFSVGLREDGIYCALTIPTKDKKKFQSKLEDPRLKKHIDDILNDKKKCLMYILELCNYRIIDWKQGQIKGDKHGTFSFSIRLSELKDSKIKYGDFVKIAIDCLSVTKQFDYIFKISWIDAKKPGDFRAKNRRLLKDPNKLVDEFVGFMKALIPLL